MTIPFTGWIAIILVLLGMIKGHRLFFFYVLFFMPFSAVSVFNFPGSKSTISYELFFWVIYLMSFLVIKMKTLDVIKLKSVFWGYILVFYLIISQLFTKDLKVESSIVNGFSIIQVLYVFLGVLVSASIAYEIRQSKSPLIVVKPISYSIFITSLIGIYQKIAFNFDLYYPIYIFNNSLNINAQGYTAVLENGVKRISSVSAEPSIFAQWLIVSISLFLFIKVTNKNINLTIFEITSLFFGVLTLFLSTSASAYLGLLLMSIILLCLLSYHKNWVFVLMFLILILAVFFMLKWTIIYEIFVNKLQSYSFYERYQSILFGLDIFKENPILGAGWGVVTVHNLFVSMLANAGLFGFIIFFIWISSEFIKSIKLKEIKNDLFLGQSVLLLFILLFFFQVLTGFVYVYSFFWIFFGLLIGDNMLAKNAKEMKCK